MDVIKTNKTDKSDKLLNTLNKNPKIQVKLSCDG